MRFIKHPSQIKNLAKSKSCQTDTSGATGQSSQTDSVKTTDIEVQCGGSAFTAKVKESQTESDFALGIKTLLLGDETLAKLNTNSLSSKYGKVLKIAKPGGILKELRETAEFYLDKLHNIETVIFHCCT